MEDIKTTITKVSDTEIEIKETIPEKVIPAVENKTVISVFDLKAKIDELNGEKSKQIEYLATPQEEMNKINARISEIDSQISLIQSQIDEAIAQGVQDPAQPIETIEPVVDTPAPIEEITG